MSYFADTVKQIFVLNKKYILEISVQSVTFLLHIYVQLKTDTFNIWLYLDFLGIVDEKKLRINTEFFLAKLELIAFRQIV